MSKIELTAEDKFDLETRHKKVRDIRTGDRIKAVLLSSEGWGTTMIAQALRKHETCILPHLKDFIEEQRLHCANGASCEKLSESQTEELIAHLREHLYQHNHQIVAYINVRFGIDYIPSQAYTNGCIVMDLSTNNPRGPLLRQMSNNSKPSLRNTRH